MYKQLISSLVLLLPPMVSTASNINPDTLQTVAKRDVPEVALAAINDFWLQQYPADSSASERAASVKATTGEDFLSPKLPRELLTRAESDSCYYGIGDPGNAIYFPPCAYDGAEKVNGSYVWGMDKLESKLWWGTIANAVCTVAVDTGLPQFSVETSAYVCEGAAGAVPPGVVGMNDWREPEIYSYDLARDSRIRHLLKGEDLTNLQGTTGLRAVGAVGSIVFLGGPAYSEDAIYLFAFRSIDGRFLGSVKLTEYSNIRSITRIGKQLYLAVSVTGAGGAIVRWAGNELTPFVFETVGTVDGQSAFLVEHENRIFVSTWPSFSTASLVNSESPGLFMSGPLAPEGILPASTDPWTNVFRFSDYEPDFVTSLSYAGGAMASYQGHLYWGTMHFPTAGIMAAAFAHQLCSVSSQCDYNLDADDNGSLGPLELLGAFLGTYRATSVFRGQNFTGGTPDIEMLYGNPILPVYDPTTRTYLNFETNNMPDPVPGFGLSGFNDFFNLYSWTMAVHQDSLYVGTFDWTFLLGADFFTSDAFRAILETILDSDIGETLDPAMLAQIRFPLIFPGADIYRFDDSVSPALPEAIGGVGNIANYGVRTMVSDENLWIGTANPMNLLVDVPPIGNIEMMGGWEVIQLGDLPLQLRDVNVPVFGALGAMTLSLLILGTVWRRRRLRPGQNLIDEYHHDRQEFVRD